VMMTAGVAAGGKSNQGGAGANGGVSTTGGVNVNGGTLAGGGTEPNGGTASAGTTSGSGGSSAAGMPSDAGAAGMASEQGGAPNPGAGGAAGDTTSPGLGGEGGGGIIGCGGKPLGWAQHPANVMFLIDRSGTMFDPNSKPWVTVRDAALPVIDAYDNVRKVGFLSMTGEIGTCPLFDEVLPALGSYSAIASKYNALAKPTKGESPFMLALNEAGQQMLGAYEGSAYVIMVIDGEPDYCNDGDDLCPIDSVVARIQALKASGITTLIAGLPIYQGADAAVCSAALQSYANAGAGLPVASVGDTVQNIYFRCNSGSAVAPSWKAEFNASGKLANQALGSYSASPGSAPYTSLDPSDAAGMTTKFQDLFARTRSCSFDAQGGEVVLGAEASGVVKIDAQVVPHGAQNGWSMSSSSVLTLNGSACQTWRSSTTSAVSVGFPCDAVKN
jgi:hypothetical protein